MVIKAVKGIKDILPPESGKWQKVEIIIRTVFNRFNYKEILLPIFEKSEVFIKGVGETTDIVQKEMYTFTDRGGDSLTLRPEGTASCVRAFIEHSMHHPKGTVSQLFYIGPMFRRERPQAGRFRQFYQVGAEMFGTDKPEADAESIHLLITMLKECGVEKPNLLINSLGCGDCRPTFIQALVGYLAEREDALCPQCVERYKTNPLRVLDCKNDSCQALLKDAPAIDEYWCDDCTQHFVAVRKTLEGLGIEYEINKRMVRGLDYYNRTVFEITSTRLGAQNSIAGGGRYDSLVKNSGGADVPAIGFAVGIERLIESIDDSKLSIKEECDIFMACIGEKARNRGLIIAGKLRETALKVLYPHQEAGLKNLMGKANKAGARLAVIIGENELAKGIGIIKDLSTGEQSEASLDDLIEKTKDILKTH